ncbi:MAG: carboxypeptidase-like regulatory domain-containing protein [Chitinophagales bacterium]
MKQYIQILTFGLLMFLFANPISAQNNKDKKSDPEVVTPTKKEVVQFSGIIRDITDGTPIPFATVYVDKIFRGTISNIDGFFSMAVAKGDSIVIRSVGYKEERLQIPPNLKGDSYHLLYALENDTIMLDEVVIYPWSKLHFRQHFINLEIPDDLQQLAEETFAKSTLAEFSEWTDYDGNENFDQFINNYVGEIYYQGQSAPIQLLNPFAWAQFVKAIKAGKFKRSKKDVIKY